VVCLLNILSYLITSSFANLAISHLRPPEALVNAMQFMEVTNLKRGDRVLVTGASGGRGSLVVQASRATVGDGGLLVVGSQKEAPGSWWRATKVYISFKKDRKSRPAKSGSLYRRGKDEACFR
jgi:hypothetical protein